MPFRHTFRVRSYELDSLGHTNNAVYFSWLEEATFVGLAEHGLTLQRFDELGWIPVLVRAAIDFRAETHSGDEIEVLTWPERYGTTSLTLGYRLERTKDRALVAEGQRVWVCVDGERNKLPVPEELRAAFGPAGVQE